MKRMRSILLGICLILITILAIVNTYILSTWRCGDDDHGHKRIENNVNRIFEQPEAYLREQRPIFKGKQVVFPDVASILPNCKPKPKDFSYQSFVYSRFQESKIKLNQCLNISYTPEELVCAAECPIEEPELEHSIRKFRIGDHSIKQLYHKCVRHEVAFLIWIDDKGEFYYLECYDSVNIRAYHNLPFRETISLFNLMKCLVLLPRNFLFGFEPSDYSTPLWGGRNDEFRFMGPLTGIMRYVGTRAHDGTLIPTSSFIVATSHCKIRDETNYWEFCSNVDQYNNIVPWEKRKPIALWRGLSSGMCASWDCFEQNPRVRLVSDYGNRTGFDVGFNCRKPGYYTPSKSSNWYTKPAISKEVHATYKYLIHVDGNSASWGLAHKLASRSIVLWMESNRDYREHYYNLLKPWVHYVPVLMDGSNLDEIREWLVKNDDVAKKISENTSQFINERMRPQDLHCYMLRLFYSVANAQSIGPKATRVEMQRLLQENFSKLRPLIPYTKPPKEKT